MFLHSANIFYICEMKNVLENIVIGIGILIGLCVLVAFFCVLVFAEDYSKTNKGNRIVVVQECDATKAK